MSDTSSMKPKPGLTGHPALSRKIHKRVRNHPSESMAGGKTMISDNSSVISSSTRPNLEKNTRYENTFRIEPRQGKEFKGVSKVHDAAYGIMEAYLGTDGYDKDKSPTQTRDIAEMIKKRVRDLNYERYKLVVSVLLGENAGQSLEHASRYLWNTKTDTFITVNYKNANLFATATIYVVYFE